MKSISIPAGLALIVCDDIIEDKFTGKKTLVGIFSQISAPQFPARHPKLAIFISFHDAKGDYNSALRIISEKSGAVVVETQGELHVKSPLDVLDIHFNFMNIEFPEPGFYNIEFLCSDELVMQRRFAVQEVKPQ